MGRLGPVILAVALAGLFLLGSARVSERSAGPRPGIPGARVAGPERTTLPAAVGPAARPVLPVPDGTGQSEIRADPNDSLAAPYTGIETNLTAYAPTQLPPFSFFQVSGVAIVGPYAVVYGVFQNSTIGPWPFYEVYENSTDQLLRLAYWPALPLVPGAGYLFALSRTTGTHWEVSINGRPFGDDPLNATLDLQATSGTYARGIGYAETAYIGGNSFVPPTVTVTLAFATRTSGGWYLPTRAAVTNIGHLGTPWGIEGTAQHPTLAPGEITSGPAIAPVPNGTILWQGGPVPVAVALHLAAPTTPANGLLGLSVSVTRPGGGPISGAYLQLRDDLGGTFVPPTVMTGPAGNATAVFQAPNASANTLDPITANVTLFGFLGSATAPHTVLGVVHVTLDGPASATVPPSGSLGLTLRATDPNGSAVGGLAIAFSVNGSANVSPTAGLTGPDGRVSAQLFAPATPGTLRFQASVIAAGYWGVRAVLVYVERIPPAWYAPVLPYLLPAALVALGAVALAVLVRWILTPNRPLPPLARLRPPPRRPPPPPAPPP